MRFVTLIGAAALLALGACSTLTGGNDTPAPRFNPAACTQKDFVIYFEEGQTELTDGAERIIHLQARDIRGCIIESVRVVGLSDQDEEGGATAREISVRRAEVLATYLVSRIGWPRSRFEILARGAHGAVTDEGLDVPVRNRARIIVESRAP